MSSTNPAVVEALGTVPTRYARAQRHYRVIRRSFRVGDELAGDELAGDELAGDELARTLF